MGRPSRSKRLFIALVATGLVLALAGPALAVKGGNGNGKPDKPATTTTSEAPGWTCQARVKNGAVWELGKWDVVTYTYLVTGLPACIDIDEAGHTSQQAWTVTWSGGETARGTIKGIKMLFEQGVHGTVYDEIVVTSTSGSWSATIDAESADPLVFVAMPRQGDKWLTAPTFSVSPVP